jgi:uncharacterized protein (TIGR03118 family)
MSIGRVQAGVLVLAVCAAIVAGCSSSNGGNAMPAAPTPTVTFAASAAAISVGQSVMLSWSATIPASPGYGPASVTCTASGAWSGAQPASGTQTVTPAAAGSPVYTLSCNAGGASASKSATVTVNAASAYSITNLVSDGAVAALTTDSNLVNPWGLATGPGDPMWVANNGSSTSTLYDGNGKGFPASGALVVALPAASGGGFDPSGLVYNGTGSATDFTVSAGGQSGPALFLFDGEAGVIGGWSASVSFTSAAVAYSDNGGAVYKGLALANNGSGNFLYATDFHNNKVDVFDAGFNKQTPAANRFKFQDPTLPAGYAPFGIQAIGNGAGGATQLYVSYAQQLPPDNHDNADGAGLGLVDIYDANGNFLKHLIPVGGALNAPWGLALAPADFGTLGNALLVGNFGDGAINGYDPASGQFIGTLRDASGAAIANPGLWGISFGNGAQNQPTNTLFFSAGINDENDGLYGRIDLGATAPALNTPPTVTLSPAGGSVSGSVTLTATVTGNLPIAKVQFFANATSLIGTSNTAPYSVSWNTGTVANGSVTLTATATDQDGDVGSSTPLTVTVANAGPPVSVTLGTPNGNLAGTVSLSATVQNDSAAVQQVQFFANGTPLMLNGTAVPAATAAPYAVQWDTNFVANGQVTLTAQATDAAAHVTTSSPVTVTVANAAVTLTDIQANVFTPICSTCHTGGGNTLPGVQNLKAGESFANIVNVPSIEQPGLDRILPNDPDNSYMIHKVEGAPGISGSRMPLGCSGASCLPQGTIDMMRQWVYAGAPNN